MQRHIFRLAALASLASLAGCGITSHLPGMGSSTDGAALGQSAAPPSVFGYAVADEPQAALVGRQTLDNGGNAADAAVAMGFALSVTLPSRAGIGGGGACIIKMPGSPATTLMFPPGATAAAGNRPAAIPALPRGLLALQARYGTLPAASVISPAERLAGGMPVSPALAADLQVVGPALLADPAAAAVFGAEGHVLTAGETLVQPDLAATLEILRTQGVEGFYAGSFGQNLATAAEQAGGGLTAQDLTQDHPSYAVPNLNPSGNFTIATIPTAAPASIALPASASFAALDKNGGAVACDTTMNNLFGTGRIAAGTGILLAASPAAGPMPELAAGIAYSTGTGNFRAAATGTGQQGAATAATTALANALSGQPNTPVPDPGRANVISCPGGVPGGEATCTASADPRGQGLALGGR